MLHNIKPIGLKGLLIQLEAYPPKEDSIIIEHAYEAYETEGGRPAVKINELPYKSKGTIIAMSDEARQNSSDLNIGDVVHVEETALTPSFRYYEERDKKVREWTGYILVTPSLVQVKLAKPKNNFNDEFQHNEQERSNSSCSCTTEAN